MAAIDLTAATLPTVYTFTAATTWQEVYLPSRCRVTVTCESVAGYMAFKANGDPASPEEPEDGGAVGTHRQKIPADAPLSFRLKVGQRTTGVPLLFVAGSTGTPTMTVALEEVES